MTDDQIILAASERARKGLRNGDIVDRSFMKDCASAIATLCGFAERTIAAARLAEPAAPEPPDDT